MKSIQQMLLEKQGGLTKAQRLLGAFITEHLDKAAFKTSFELSALVGVSQSTVVRFATALGYDGFSGLQKALQDELKYRLSALERFELIKEAGDDLDVLEGISALDALNIKKNAGRNDIGTLKDLCFRLNMATRVYIYGQGPAAAAADYLSSYLRVLLPSLLSINQTGQEPLLAAGPMQSGDLLLCISFPIHTDTTKKLLSYAKSRDTAVALICESKDSELGRYADIVMVSECGDYGLNGTLAPVISLCGAITCILAKNDERAEEKLSRLGDAASYQLAEL